MAVDPIATIIPELLTLDQAAKLVNVGARSLWRYAHNGVAPRAVHVGRAYRFRRDELLTWIAGGCQPINGGATK